MPFKMIGRCTSISTSLVSEYSSRVLKPPPIAIRHRASDSHGDKPDKLSRAMIQPFPPVIINLLHLHDTLPKGTAEASTTEHHTLAAVLLAVPCSPCRINT